jgi:hypothetical protein
MRNRMYQGTHPSEEAMRNTRLARGLRAVAATLIVGGIVIAAFDTAPTAGRSTPQGTGVDPVESDATGVPLVNPTRESPVSAPAAQDDDRALGRVEKSMESHG